VGGNAETARTIRYFGMDQDRQVRVFPDTVNESRRSIGWIETCTRAFPLLLPMDPDDPANNDRGSNRHPLGPCRKQRAASNRRDCGVNAVIVKRLVSPSFAEATQAVSLSWAVILFPETCSNTNRLGRSNPQRRVAQFFGA
jgi:hypothetical protein